MPPWVRAQFHEAARIVRKLRDTNCGNTSCDYCRVQNDPKLALKRWFDFDAFRPEPADASGRPLQEVIVASAMKGESLLGILPTGTGKSVCYQLPALSRFDKTGALTVVISPPATLASSWQPSRSPCFHRKARHASLCWASSCPTCGEKKRGRGHHRASNVQGSPAPDPTAHGPL